MKKILFYVCCVQFITLMGCNNADKEEKSVTSDTTKVAESKERAAISAADQISMADANATGNFLSQQYIIFKNTTQYVTFDYNSFLTFISERANGNSNPSPDVELVYGALTKSDTSRYLSSHPEVNDTDKKGLYNQPCLLEGYEDKNGNLAYTDKAMSLCPPPTSCQATFEIKAATIYNANPLVPSATIENFNVKYNEGGSRGLTKSVKFNIEMLKYWKKHFDDSLKMNAPNISFRMGAYTNKDAARNGQEVGKPCLLFAYEYDKDPKGDPKYLYVDFGILVPH